MRIKQTPAASKSVTTGRSTTPPQLCARTTYLTPQLLESAWPKVGFTINIHFAAGKEGRQSSCTPWTTNAFVRSFVYSAAFWKTSRNSTGHNSNRHNYMHTNMIDMLMMLRYIGSEL